MKLVNEFRRKHEVRDLHGVYIGARRRWVTAGAAQRGGGNIEALVTARTLEDRFAVTVENDAGEAATGFGIGSEVQAFVVGSVGAGCAVSVNIEPGMKKNSASGLLNRKSSQLEGKAG